MHLHLSALHQLEQAGEAAAGEQVLDIDLDAQLVANQGEQLHRDQGIPAQREEVVVVGKGIRAQNRRPHRAQPLGQRSFVLHRGCRALHGAVDGCI